ncbi:MAG: IgGFc-binding protein [Deltaproteobacteria bacterium]|nr:IgGFc-binding protein [Deltaproteobacteria bacterium]
MKPASRLCARLLLASSLAIGLGLALGCSAGGSRRSGAGGSPAGTTGGGGTSGAGGTTGVGGTITGTGGLGIGGGFDASTCELACSSDLHAVINCEGTPVEKCEGTDGCDMAIKDCVNACQAAASNKQSVGCEYYATFMDTYSSEACFAAFVANTWNTAAHIKVEYKGQPLDVQSFARIPTGSGPGLSYAPFSAADGIPPSEVVVLFLSGPQGQNPKCPAPSAVPSGVELDSQTTIGFSFRIESDVPVVAYQINPYGGGMVAVTGASLLLPTSAWDTNYVAVNAYRNDLPAPSLNIVAAEDNTNVKMVPVAPVQGGPGIPASPANTLFEFVLFKGQHAQITQEAELTGSIVSSDKPVGFMAGHRCMRTPFQVAYCDHGEQMIPPVRALGSEYVGVMYRPRSGEPAIWRLVGAVDETALTWTPPVGGPATLGRGQVVEFITGTPFVVKSQDEKHPFMLFTYMSGSQWEMLSDKGGYGDVDFVISVPPQQYMHAYVFFADPTYPETNLVLVRAKGADQKFHDVTLDCVPGPLPGWQAVGDYEWTRADLITGDFQNVGQCSTGRHEVKSDAPFGLWVWGWGTPLTKSFTENVSYGYPGGMNVQPINPIVIPPTPK